MNKYAYIKTTHNHICTSQCELPETVIMTKDEYVEYVKLLKPGELPAIFYKGMKIAICPLPNNVN